MTGRAGRIFPLAAAAAAAGGGPGGLPEGDTAGMAASLVHGAGFGALSALTWEDATSRLIRLSGDAADSAAGSAAGASVDATDALRRLLGFVEDECAELADSASAGGKASGGSASAKYLPRTLKWCAAHLHVLHAFLRPPTRPRVVYGGGGALGGDGAGDGAGVLGGAAGGGVPPPWTRRLGKRRLLVVEILCRLVTAKRAPLTAALADERPSIVLTAVGLIGRHPSSSILAAAVKRLVEGALALKPLRAALMAGVGGGGGGASASASAPSLQGAIAKGLLAASTAAPLVGEAPKRETALAVQRPAWRDLASLLDALAASDKPTADKLKAEASWLALGASRLPSLKGVEKAEWKCGPPPARPTAGMSGEMGELLAMLKRMPSDY